MAFLLCGKESNDRVSRIKQCPTGLSVPDDSKVDSVTMVIKRLQRGFGFSVTGSSPACVRRVDEGSAAWQAGLRVDDAVIRINGQNVSRSIADSVAKIVRQSENQIIIDIQRKRSEVMVSPEDEKMWRAHIDRKSLCSSSTESSLDLSDTTSRDLLIDLSGFEPPRVPRMSSTPIQIHSRDLSPQEQDRQAAIQNLLKMEQEFIDQMQFGIQRYSNPLRHQFVSPTEHRTLFQNVEKLVSISEYHVYKLTENYDIVGCIYSLKVLMMTEIYLQYCNGIKDSFRLVAELKDFEEFNQFLQEPSLEAGQLTVSGFIQKPLEHIKNLVLNLQQILSLTSLEHQDLNNLSQVIEVLRSTCNRINESNTRRSRSMTSLVSRSKRKSSSKGSRSSGCGSSVSSGCSRSSDSMSSIESSESFVSGGSSGIESSIDTEVLDVQRQLVFSDNVPPFQLATATRHMIYSEELTHVDDEQCSQLYVILMSDMLLLTQVEPDDTLLVVDFPILLHDILDTDFQDTDTMEFTLGVESSTCAAWLEPCDVTLRAPSLEQMFVWKNILEHRINSSKVQQQFLKHDNVI